MLIEIPGILNEAQLDKMQEILAGSSYQDGRATAGMAAARVKKNQELQADPQQQALLNRILMASLGHNAMFRNAALPAKVADFIFSRYQPGMTYGDHVDDPIMGGNGPKFRTDVSMTVFLSDSSEYEGGELLIRTSFGDTRIKGNAGDAVVYPSSSLHQVAPVTAGERRVALTWIQSFVRDPAKRELLFELNLTRESLLKSEPDSERCQHLDRSYANLMRMWSDV